MSSYPTDDQARALLVEMGRRLYERGYAAANDGNLSVMVGPDALWATPTGVSKGYMTEQMMVRMDLDGNVLSDGRPSSEIRMHLAIYRANPALRAVVHVHPPVSTTFAAAGVPLDRALLQEGAMLLGVIPVAPYAAPGSDALAEGAAAYCRDYNGVLLAHHGAVTWGDNLTQAAYRMESLEYTAQVQMYSRLLGFDRLLTDAQVDELLRLRAKWGVTSGGRPVTQEDAKLTPP